MSFGVSSGRVCIILYGYNGARDEKTKWRRRKFPSGIIVVGLAKSKSQFVEVTLYCTNV